MYDYQSSLTGIDNRSSVDSFDDNIFFSLIIVLCTLIGTEASAVRPTPFFQLCFALLIRYVMLTFCIQNGGGIFDLSFFCFLIACI